jgi:hypothetical protein
VVVALTSLSGSPCRMLITNDGQIIGFLRGIGYPGGAILMSAYNTVVLAAEVQCPRCGSLIRRRVQFKYGDTRQHDYAIGDRIRRGATTSASPQPW